MRDFRTLSTKGAQALAGVRVRAFESGLGPGSIHKLGTVIHHP